MHVDSDKRSSAEAETVRDSYNEIQTDALLKGVISNDIE